MYSSCIAHNVCTQPQFVYKYSLRPRLNYGPFGSRETTGLKYFAGLHVSVYALHAPRQHE